MTERPTRWKAILAYYWIIGCLSVGIGLAGHANRCPDDTMPVGGAIEAVLTWPMVVTAALVWNGKQLSACTK